MSASPATDKANTPKAARWFVNRACASSISTYLGCRMRE